MTNYNELRDGQEFYGNGYKKGYEDAKKELAKPQGEWIADEQGVCRCSLCNHIPTVYTGFNLTKARLDNDYKYCRFCGAKMGVKKNETDN